MTLQTSTKFKFLKFEGPEMDISTTNVAMNMVRNNDLIMKNKIMGMTWRGGWHKAPCFFQIFMECLSPKGGCALNLTCSTWDSILACRACGRHSLAFEEDQKIFDCVLKPILDNTPKYNVEGPRIKGVDEDALPNEELIFFSLWLSYNVDFWNFYLNCQYLYIQY